MVVVVPWIFLARSPVLRTGEDLGHGLGDAEFHKLGLIALDAGQTLHFHVRQHSEGNNGVSFGYTMGSGLVCGVREVSRRAGLEEGWGRRGGGNPRGTPKVKKTIRGTYLSATDLDRNLKI